MLCQIVFHNNTEQILNTPCVAGTGLSSKGTSTLLYLSWGEGRMVAHFSQSDTSALEEGKWAGIVARGLLILLLLLWNLCPVSKLEQEWSRPSTTQPPARVVELLSYSGGWAGGESSNPLPCTCLDIPSATQSWLWREMVMACPSRSETIALDWELWGNGAAPFWLHFPRIELPSHWAGDGKQFLAQMPQTPMVLTKVCSRFSWIHVSLFTVCP